MLPHALVHDEMRQIFPVKIFAGGYPGLRDDRVMFQAKPRPLPGIKALPTVVNAVPAAE
jgi:hypothetical protein